jgi:ribulose-5-phosphate 4-epimerase/fuculose-1-phosphate aldolase
MAELDTTLAQQVASTARGLVRAGLVEAFGHVSTRLDDAGLLITPTTPLAGVDASQVVQVDASGAPLQATAPAPLELPLHLAIYRARPEVHAICRGHGPSMVAWGTTRAELPLRHGLGLLAGTRVRVHPERDLITTLEAGDAAATTLGEDPCVLLWANGGLATGADLLDAATRLWFLEERARVALEAPALDPAAGAPASPDAASPDPSAAAWTDRGRHSRAELTRARAWFAATYLHDDPTPPTDPQEPT